VSAPDAEASPPTAHRTWRDRLAAVLDLQWLYFVAPGGTCLLACLFPLIYEGRIRVPAVWSAQVLGYALLAYVMGVVCFAIGRQLRRRVERWSQPRGALHDRLFKAMTAHRLVTALQPPEGRSAPPGGRSSPLAAYTSSGALYRRMWAELRQDPRLAPTARLLGRRAVLAACQDGPAVAFLVWAAVFWVVPSHVARWPTPPNASLAIGIVFVALAGCCWAEAQRAGKDQLRDLAATLAQRYGAGAPAAAAEDAPSPAPAEAAAETC